MNHKRHTWAFIVLFVAAACAFEHTVITLTVALVAWLLYAVIVRRDRRVIVCLLSSALFLTLFEVVGRRIIAHKIGRTYQLNVDHRMRPNPQAGINRDGIRCDFEAEDFTDETYNIIFLGDSFTYGESLPPPARPFPDLVAEILDRRRPELRVRAVNFAWVSSSPLLSLRLLRDIGAKYKPDLVVLAVDMTDFHDDLRYRAQQRVRGVSATYFLLKNLKLDDDVAELWEAFRFRDLVPEGDVPRQRFFITNQPLYESRPYLHEIETNIQAISD